MWHSVCFAYMWNPWIWGPLFGGNEVSRMLAIVLVGCSLALGALAGPIELQNFDTHSRLSIALDSGVAVDQKFGPKGFTVLFKDVSLVDLGAPFGQERAWLKTLDLRGDTRVGNLTLQETTEGVVLSGQWKFPTGKAALAKPEMEVFSFRDKEPSLFVLDLWVKKGITLAEARRREEEAHKKRESELRAALQKKAEERKLAFYHEEVRPREVEDFCRTPVSETNDVILALRPAHPRLEFKRWFPMTIADEDFRYTQPDPVTVEKSREAQFVRLAQKLYEDGRPALAVRTVDFLRDEFPQSKFLPEMKFLATNALKKLGHDEAYARELEALALDLKGTPIGQRASQYLAATAYEQGEYMKAMEQFMTLIRDYPKSPKLWVYHLGVAESLYEIKQTDRAAKEYQWILENTEDVQAQAEAAFRSGDLYLDRKQYEQALASYFRGLKHYGDQSKQYPEVHLNHAESLYGLGQFDRAAELYRNFLSTFPGHPSGWRATFRIGEILGRKTEASEREAARGWFYDTINLFPMSKGAVLSRLKLLPCGDHGGYTQATAERFFREQAEGFEGGTDVDMTGYSDALALTKVRTLSIFGDPTAALNVGVKALAARAGDVTQREITAIIRNEFKKEILELLDNGKNNEALAVYKKFTRVLSESDQGVSPYFVLRLSGAAADLNLGILALSLVKDYDSRMKAYENGQKSARMLASGTAGTPQDDVLSAEYFDKRLLQQEQAMAEARAVWMSSRSVEKVRALLTGVTQESAAAYDKEMLLSVADAEAGQSETALEHALKAFSYLPDLDKRRRAFGEGRHHQTLAWIATLQERAGRTADAAKSYQAVVEEQGDSKLIRTHSSLTGLGVPDPISGADAWMKIAALQEQLKQWDAAASAYEAAQKAGRTGPAALYSYARVLERSPASARKKQAQEVLQKIVDAPGTGAQDEFWKNLAKQKLATQSLESNQGG